MTLSAELYLDTAKDTCLTYLHRSRNRLNHAADSLLPKNFPLLPRCGSLACALLTFAAVIGCAQASFIWRRLVDLDSVAGSIETRFSAHAAMRAAHIGRTYDWT
jgi:hypothetical protein